MSEVTTAFTTDNVRVRLYDADDAPTPAAAREADPLAELTEHNTTRPSYHKAIIGGLDGDTLDLEVDALALGNDDAASVSEGSILGNETLRVALTDTVRDGQSFTAIVFLDTSQGNDQSFFEGALVAETSSGDIPINRVVFDDPQGRLDPKRDDVTATIEIEITQQDA